jgi:hypothetical protein
MRYLYHRAMERFWLAAHELIPWRFTGDTATAWRLWAIGKASEHAYWDHPPITQSDLDNPEAPF